MFPKFTVRMYIGSYDFTRFQVRVKYNPMVLTGEVNPEVGRDAIIKYIQDAIILNYQDLTSQPLDPLRKKIVRELLPIFIEWDKSCYLFLQR